MYFHGGNTVLTNQMRGGCLGQNIDPKPKIFGISDLGDVPHTLSLTPLNVPFGTLTNPKKIDRDTLNGFCLDPGSNFLKMMKIWKLPWNPWKMTFFGFLWVLKNPYVQVIFFNVQYQSKLIYLSFDIQHKNFYVQFLQ